MRKPLYTICQQQKRRPQVTNPQSQTPEDRFSHDEAHLLLLFQIVDPLIVDMIRNKPDLKVFNYYGEEFVHQ